MRTMLSDIERLREELLCSGTHFQMLDQNSNGNSVY